MTAAIAGKRHEQEIAHGERFPFGENWRRFLQVVDEARIQTAVDSLKAMLEVDALSGQSFLDVGSGSGLFSLAARRLGARVVSVDYDPGSVACTRELRRRYCGNCEEWQVQQGSVLDAPYMARLGKFDVVYSWGVLHHTGDLWAAMASVDGNVAAGGKLFLALYNDQGRVSRVWTRIKRAYNALPAPLRAVLCVAVFGPLELRSLLGYLLRGCPQRYFANIRHYGKRRGMSWWRDQVDWIGGYPFEVSKPEQVFDFYRSRGYRLLRLKTCRGEKGCNEYVFRRETRPDG
jgi:2-polyprenyl-3-methyl-5-hydroxy-6-metoxy-1,4-benzoquinol methylase